MLRFLLPYIAHAQIEYDISTPIPSSGDVAFSDINTYVSSIFSFGVYLAFGLALTIIVYGGVRYAASFANEKEISGAKDWIWSAFAGLLVLITATLLLNTINPDILTANPFSASDPSVQQKESPRNPSPQPNGERCSQNPQCQSGYCDTGGGPFGYCKDKPTTITPKPLSGLCNNDIECGPNNVCALIAGGPTCVAGTNLPSGADCRVDRQCASGDCGNWLNTCN